MFFGQLFLSYSLKYLGYSAACTHLSPGVSLIYDLAHDSGMLQSELFTSRNQNLVLAKLPNSGFWRYGQFFKWNRVKMAKNGLKMVEIFWGASHMINDNIFNIFCFSTFSFGYFTNPAFWLNFKKIFNPFLVIFGHFYPISLDKFALTPKTRLPQFTRNLILTPTGK